MDFAKMALFKSYADIYLPSDAAIYYDVLQVSHTLSISLAQLVRPLDLCSRTRDAFERVSVRDWLKRSFDCTRRCTLVGKMASKPYNLLANSHMYTLFNAH